MVEADSQSTRTPYLGREVELDRLRALVDGGGGLITVTGPPGIGKTRFVRRFAQQAVEAGQLAEGAAVFCDLESAWSVADIATAVSRSLDVHLSAGEGTDTTVELLGRAIASRGPMLLILDNFEQLVGFAADTVSRWVAAAPQARIVATSRDRLRLRGESVVELPPLPAEVAVALFVHTADRLVGGYSLDTAGRAAVHELVGRLDGIPLAVELAAARVTVMSPQRMLDRIGKRFQLLGHGPADGIARQATLRAAIDWSWELLTPDERSTLAQCSVFRGGFSLDAAEGTVVLDGGEDVLDQLESLCRKSLVRTRRDEGADLRFEVYESVRDYAAEHLGDRAVDVAGRHAIFYIERGEDQVVEFGSPEGTDVGWLDANRDNLIAALHAHKTANPPLAARAMLCLAHAQLRHGPYDSLLDLLAEVPATPQMDPITRVRLVFALGVGESMLGRTDAAAARIEEARDLAESHELDRMVAKTALHLGLNQLRVGQLEAARSHLESGLALARAGGFQRIQARALASMGMAHEAVAGFTEAEACYKEAGAIARKVGDRWEEARSRSKMGTLCSFMEGRQDEARGHLEWALARSEAIGDSFIAATSSFNLGRLELNLGQHAEAEEHLCHALSVYRDMANRVSEGFVRMGLGLLHLDRGATDSAIAELELAADVLQAIAHPLASAFNHVTLGMALLIDGDAATAMERAATAMEQMVAKKHAVLEGVSAVVCGLAALAQGDSSAAEAFNAQANRCLADSGWGEGLAMLAVADAAGKMSAAGTVDLPPLDDVRFARARVGWRIVSALQSGEQHRAQPLPAKPVGATSTPGVLVIGPDCTWFQPPGAPPVDLRRKRTLRPMLELLARYHRTEPGVALDTDQLFNGVWSGERALPRARKNRVYVSIATLRKMGLGDMLTTRGDGYLLDPSITVRIC